MNKQESMMLACFRQSLKECEFMPFDNNNKKENVQTKSRVYYTWIDELMKDV